MKNKSLLLSLFVLAAMAVGQKTWAQTLYVGGVRVNLEATTQQTITGSSIEGKVTYNPGNKTLYLEDAVIHGSIYGTQLGSSATDRYFVRLKGANSLIASDRGIRFDNSYVVLHGGASASLTVNSSASSSGFSCIGVEYGHFEVWGIKLSLTGASKGFYGTAASSTLKFINSIVDVNCEAGAVYGFKSVSFDDCLCTDEGLTFTSGTGYVDSDKHLATRFHVRPFLMVGDEPVRTASNYMTGSHYSWSWTKSTNTLEITGNLTSTDYSGISNRAIEGLNIKTDGFYDITSSFDGIDFWKDTNFTGTGKLVVISRTGSGIVARGDMTIFMGGLEVYGKKYGLVDEMRAHKLTVKKFDDNSDYRFAGATQACFCMSDLEMDGMDICTSDTWWNPSDGYAYKDNDIFSSSTTYSSEDCVCFRSQEEIQYIGLYIGETNIRKNCTHHIVSPAITSGSVAYNSSTKTLTLTDATLTNTDGTFGGGIDNRDVDGLTIKLEGDNTITARSNPIHSKQSCTITGEGTLTGTATNGCGIYLSGDNITCIIDGPQIDLKGSFGIIDGRGTATLELTGNTTSLTLQNDAYNYKTIHNLGRLVLLTGLGIHEPTNGYFDESLKSVTIDGTNPYKGKIDIHKKIDYGMYVGEKHVTSANAPDILGNGQFKYDPSTKTLTVTNATLINTEGPMGAGICNDEIEGLNIAIVGDNTFTVRNQAITSSKSFFITGDGKLTCISEETSGLYLEQRNILCTINGPQLDFISHRVGLQDKTGAATLDVSGSTTRLTFAPYDEDPFFEAFFGLGSLRLGSGISIIEPEGGYFDESLMSITTDGSSHYYGKVVIGKNVDFAATPAPPQIIDFTLTGYSPVFNFYIPTEDVYGNVLQTSKLFYTVWIETEGNKKPFVVRASEYRDVTEDMVEIPYEYNDSWDIYWGGGWFYINPIDEPAYCTKFGLQSIYYGGGERNTSNIVWMDNPAYDPTGIRSIDNDANGQMVNGKWSDGKCYNLSGQRLSKPMKGINIINGKKTLVK